MTYEPSKVRYVSVIRIEGGENILDIPYAELMQDPDLIAGFVTAVIIFARNPIRTIRKGSYDVLIEVGDTVLLLLVVDPVLDEAPYREKMRRIIRKIETEHGSKLKTFEGDVRVYKEFALDILIEFPFPVPDPSLIPVQVPPDQRPPIPYVVGSTHNKVEKVLSFVNGKRTVSEILERIGLPDAEVNAIVSMLWKYKWVEFRKRLEETDILQVATCVPTVLERFREQYGLPLDEILRAFDGVKTIREVILSLPYDPGAIWFLVNKLVEVNCLSPVQRT
ncbi:MAG: hypothetical protein QXS20_10175 [Candidatus Thorarchaeota archaeon]